MWATFRWISRIRQLFHVEICDSRPQVAQELAPVEVARGLSAGDEEAWGTQGRQYKRGCPFRGTAVPWTSAVSCPQAEHAKELTGAGAGRRLGMSLAPFVA